MAKLAKNTGNVTVVDLGEEVDKVLVKRIDQKLKAAGVVGKAQQKEQMAGPGSSSYRAGGYRPGMFGYRPWYADKQNKFGATMGSSYSEKMRGLSRPNLTHLGIGAGIGALGNAALLRVTPDIVKSDLSIVHNAIAFTIGLIPVLAKPNSYTLGVAVPGAVMLAMSFFNFAMDQVGIKKPALRGSDASHASIESSVSARAKLQQVHQQINRTAQNPARVTAQAVA
jgi:hypothetical protein